MLRLLLLPVWCVVVAVHVATGYVADVLDEVTKPPRRGLDLPPARRRIH